MSIIAFFVGRHSSRLVIIGLICTGYGIYLIKRGIEGDTLMPGTNFTYLPKWLFITTGFLLQIPLPAAIWYPCCLINRAHRKVPDRPGALPHN